MSSPRPDMYTFLYVRGFVPLAHAVQDVPGGGALGWTQGWWGQGVRVGWNLEVGGARCSICAPYSSSWITVVIGGDVSVDLWRYERWSLVGDVRPRVMIAAVNSAERSEVPIDNRVLFQPQLALGLWHEVTTNQQRRRGWRGAWVLELEAEEWLHGRDTSPVIGFALGYAFGMCC